MIEPRGGRREDRLHAAAHRPLHARRQRRRLACSATPTGTAPAASPCSTRRRFEVKGRWENGGETPPLNYDFWYQPRKNVLVSSEFGEPNAYEKGFDLADVEAGRYGQPSPLLESGRAHAASRPSTSARTGCFRSRCAGSTIPRRRRASSARRSRARCGASSATNGGWAADQVIAVESVELEGWPFPVPGVMSDLVLSMDDRFLYFSELAARRPAPVRRLRPRQPEADRPALARRRARQAERRRPRAARRPADAAALARRPPALRHQLALLDLGQPVLSGAALLAPARQLRPERRHGGRPRLLRRLLTTAPTVPHAHTRCASRTATAPRRSSSDRRHIMGIPIEESVLQLAPAGAAMVTAVAIAGRARLGRLRARPGRRSSDEDR